MSYTPPFLVYAQQSANLSSLLDTLSTSMWVPTPMMQPIYLAPSSALIEKGVCGRAALGDERPP